VDKQEQTQSPFAGCKALGIKWFKPSCFSVQCILSFAESFSHVWRMHRVFMEI